MPVRAEHDRGVLAGLLGRDARLHAYELGDLDEVLLAVHVGVSAG